MKRFKQFTEELTGGDGSIGGLGFNSGNPAVGDSEAEKYTATNALSKDKENGYLSKYLKDNQNKLSKKIGFKSFDPTKGKNNGTVP